MCKYCTSLLSFLSTYDDNIFEIKYYNVYVEKDNKELERVLKEISQQFKEDVNGYPTVIIGDKYIKVFNEK